MLRQTKSWVVAAAPVEKARAWEGEAQDLKTQDAREESMGGKKRLDAHFFIWYLEVCVLVSIHPEGAE
jgi:hypothetical protein